MKIWISHVTCTWISESRHLQSGNHFLWDVLQASTHWYGEGESPGKRETEGSQVSGRLWPAGTQSTGTSLYRSFSVGGGKAKSWETWDWRKLSSLKTLTNWNSINRYIFISLVFCWGGGVKVLGNLRLKVVKFLEDFDQQELNQQVHFVDACTF